MEETTNAQLDDLEKEQMRQQMAALKSQLASQEIVNERLIRHVMKSRLSWINTYIIAEAVAVPILIIGFFLIDKFVVPMSPWFLIFTILILLGSVIYDRCFSWEKDSILLQGDLRNLRKSFVWKKRRIVWENIVSLVILAVWIPWLFLTLHDYMLTLDPSTHLYSGIKGSIVGLTIGFVIGIVIVLYMNWKAGRTYGDIIAQIDELLK